MTGTRSRGDASSLGFALACHGPGNQPYQRDHRSNTDNLDLHVAPPLIEQQIVGRDADRAIA
ncbi:MAG: hypothetical protein DYH03_11085 [Nitrospira sp. NTP1]|nr:hypothetical protein [Nitrospira sp. NTP1]